MSRRVFPALLMREAFDLMIYLERACQSQIAAQAGGGADRVREFAGGSTEMLSRPSAAALFAPAELFGNVKADGLFSGASVYLK